MDILYYKVGKSLSSFLGVNICAKKGLKVAPPRPGYTINIAYTLSKLSLVSRFVTHFFASGIERKINPINS